MKLRRIVLTYPHSLNISGGSVHDCTETALHFQKAGVQVILIHVRGVSLDRFPRQRDTPTDIGRNREKRLKDAGVVIMPVDTHPIHWGLDGLLVKRVLLRVLNDQRIDGVLSYWHEAAYFRDVLQANEIKWGMLAAASYEEFLEHPGNIITRPFVTKMIRWLIARPLREAFAVFPRSRFTGEEVVRFCGVKQDRVHVSYCGVGQIFFNVARKKPADITNFIFYGWLVRDKGIFDLLDALQQLFNQGIKNWKLNVAGWGDANRLRDEISKRGIDNHVEYLGVLDHQSLAAELSNAHVAMLPSYKESFGLAVAEAQAGGLPVVAYDVGAISELVKENSTGWLVPAKNVELLLLAIKEAMKDVDKTFQMGLAGRDRVAQLFSWEKSVRVIIREFESG